MFVTRAIAPVIRQASETFKVLLLTGPRQVGKTTLLQNLAEPARRYVTLDDINARDLAKRDPDLFLQRYKPPVLIDEIQYAPELLPAIKIRADADAARGQFWLTGSQSFHAMRGVSESLAGRVGIVDLLGLSFSEIEGVPSAPFSTLPEEVTRRAERAPAADLEKIYAHIFRGGMPELTANPAVNREMFFSSYLRTYIERDIRDLTQVADEGAFLRFLTLVAARTARPLNMHELANEADVSAPTVKRWLSVLVSSNLVALVQPWHHNLLARAVKTPLLHFLDTGLCAHLTGWTDARVLEQGAMSGQLFETWVFTEIYKSFLNAGRRPPIYYYRDKDKREIDLLIVENGTLYPVEIKKSAAPGTQAARHFRVLRPFEDVEGDPKIKVGSGAVLCMMSEPLPIDRQNWFVPVRVL